MIPTGVVDKVVVDADAALADATDGMVVLVGGFGPAGAPTTLLHALARRELRDLTVVANNAGSNGDGMEVLLASGAVRRLVCSYPVSPGATVFPDRHARGEVDLELVPQGTLSERIRAAGAGIRAFWVRTGADTELAAGRETREFDGRTHVLEHALPGDLALVRARQADELGNLVYHATGRNFGPTMAMAARRTVVEVDQVVPRGSLDPETVVTPGMVVDAIVPRRP